MKSVIGFWLWHSQLGFGCRAFGIPSPGAAADSWGAAGNGDDDRLHSGRPLDAMAPAQHAHDCGGPSGLTASQIPQVVRSVERCVHCNSVNSALVSNLRLVELARSKGGCGNRRRQGSGSFDHPERC